MWGGLYGSLFVWWFFYVLGYAEDNQEFYRHILETEIWLVYNRWFTIDQINELSYLDFTIYSERISSMYEQEMKEKEEAMKQAENDMQMINFDSFDSGDDYY